MATKVLPMVTKQVEQQRNYRCPNISERTSYFTHHLGNQDACMTYPRKSMPTCKYCGTIKSTSEAIKKHIQHTLLCRDKYLVELSKIESTVLDSDTHTPTCINSNSNCEQPADEVSYGVDIADETSVGASQEETGHSATFKDGVGNPGTWNFPVELPRYSEAYPGLAGMPIGSAKEKTCFELIRDAEGEDGPWSEKGFKSKEEWEVAKWLLHNVGQNQTDEFLKLPMVCCNKHKLDE
jgi:hypothetical protein